MVPSSAKWNCLNYFAHTDTAKSPCRGLVIRLQPIGLLHSYPTKCPPPTLWRKRIRLTNPFHAFSMNRSGCKHRTPGVGRIHGPGRIVEYTLAKSKCNCNYRLKCELWGCKCRNRRISVRNDDSCIFSKICLFLQGCCSWDFGGYDQKKLKIATATTETATTDFAAFKK